MPSPTRRQTLSMSADDAYSIDFAPDKYRSTHCHECRSDGERLKLAMEADCKNQITVQELKCRECGKRLPWWHFAKLPLTDKEKQHVQNERGGRAWSGL